MIPYHHYFFEYNFISQLAKRLDVFTLIKQYPHVEPKKENKETKTFEGHQHQIWTPMF